MYTTEFRVEYRKQQGIENGVIPLCQIPPEINLEWYGFLQALILLAPPIACSYLQMNVWQNMYSWYFLAMQVTQCVIATIYLMTVHDRWEKTWSLWSASVL